MHAKLAQRTQKHYLSTVRGPIAIGQQSTDMRTVKFSLRTLRKNLSPLRLIKSPITTVISGY